MKNMPEYDYHIELQDEGATRIVKTDDTVFAMHIANQDSVDRDRLEELVSAWERKSRDSGNHDQARAAYCDVAEKLDAVLNDSPWTEAP